MAGDLVPIGRFGSIAGLTVPQLRHYDRVGILSPAARDERSRYRYYSRSQLSAARVIALLRSIDMPLADIQELLAAPEPERIRRVFAEHRARVERRLSDARAALESIDRIAWEEELMPASTDTSCSFCSRPHSEAAARLTGPAGVSICQACLDLCLEVLELERQREAGGREPAPTRPAPKDRNTDREFSCAFCGRDRSAVRKLIAGPEICICDACVATVGAA